MSDCVCDLCTTSAMLRKHNPAHGKASTYRRYRCRCEECTRAASEAQRKSRSRVSTHPTVQERAFCHAKHICHHWWEDECSDACDRGEHNHPINACPQPTDPHTSHTDGGTT